MIERLQESSANLAVDNDAQEEATPDLSIKMQAPLTTFPHIDLPLPIPLPAKLSDLHCSSSTSDTAVVLGRLSKVTGLGSAAVRVRALREGGVSYCSPPCATALVEGQTTAPNPSGSVKS